MSDSTLHIGAFASNNVNNIVNDATEDRGCSVKAFGWAAGYLFFYGFGNTDNVQITGNSIDGSCRKGYFTVRKCDRVCVCGRRWKEKNLDGVSEW